VIKENITDYEKVRQDYYQWRDTAIEILKCLTRHPSHAVTINNLEAALNILVQELSRSESKTQD
jgi:hypothetical protein